MDRWECENIREGLGGDDVSTEGYHLQQTKLVNLKKELDADPSNIEAAKGYWVALASFGGHDVRSGKFAIEAFRGCALASHAGIVALAHALRELYDKSGEKPRSELFDEELLEALKEPLPDLSGEDQTLVQWVLTSF
jgi:hypothetical protein